ncbi:MAG: hypothetical protein LBI56_04015 [Puniceicoccales bacterium]|jgi:hypothetical protein|nr:hypothetical protein [Puniceicoccales bacterium]
MENFTGADSTSTWNKFNAFEIHLEQIRAYVDQKFDEISSAMDDLESRINNLR